MNSGRKHIIGHWNESDRRLAACTSVCASQFYTESTLGVRLLNRCKILNRSWFVETFSNGKKIEEIHSSIHFLVCSVLDAYFLLTVGTQ